MLNASTRKIEDIEESINSTWCL